eukprot:scaffold33147_cov21-Tisochrysis_lutea.AAC.2
MHDSVERLAPEMSGQKKWPNGDQIVYLTNACPNCSIILVLVELLKASTPKGSEILVCNFCNPEGKHKATTLIIYQTCNERLLRVHKALIIKPTLYLWLFFPSPGYSAAWPSIIVANAVGVQPPLVSPRRGPHVHASAHARKMCTAIIQYYSVWQHINCKQGQVNRLFLTCQMVYQMQTHTCCCASLLEEKICTAVTESSLDEAKNFDQTSQLKRARTKNRQPFCYATASCTVSALKKVHEAEANKCTLK